MDQTGALDEDNYSY